ncbi:MAG: hypothetical protein B7X07_06375 [Actinobacteria bacterium 21-64-8]|nr:MAG: hypothetical protein B7X07_06375 [Actinobacteria bacterium 21-64-8]
MATKGWDINIDFGAIRDDLEAKLPAAIAKGTEYLRGQVTPRVPVETGNLAGSGGVTVVGLVGALYYPGPYALYQENGVYYRYGRVGAPLRHNNGESFFLERTVAEEGKTIIRIIRDEVFK